MFQFIFQINNQSFAVDQYGAGALLALLAKAKPVKQKGYSGPFYETEISGAPCVLQISEVLAEQRELIEREPIEREPI